MNKYAIYCDSLEDEQMLKDWLKKEFDDELYQKDELFKLQKTFNFPNFKNYEGYKRGYHTGRDDNYTKINIKDFLKEYYKMNKTELLGLPIIKGEKHHLEAFLQDCEKFGYILDFNSKKQDQFIRLCYNQLNDILTKARGMDLWWGGGYIKPDYTGNDINIPIKTFNLPSDWSNALNFMKENMDRWNKIQEEKKEPEFKVGDIVVCLDTQNTLVGTKDTVYKIVEHKLNNKDFVYIGEYSCISTKRLRFATPEEIEEYNNKLKIFKMTSSSGDFELEVSKKGIYYRPEDSWVDPASIEKMLLSAIPVYGKFNSRLPLHTYTMEFETVKVGCKSGCSVKAWKEVYEYYKSLQK